MEAWIEKVEKIAQEIAEREGCLLYDIEHSGVGKNRILRVYIDKDSGVGIEDCSNVSKGLNLRLDVENIVPGAMYNLEVSTPGLDRHLKKKWHFERVVGKKVSIQLSKPLGSLDIIEDKGLTSMKKFAEVLQSVDMEHLVFEIRSNAVKVPLAAIEKAKLVFEYKINSKKNVKKK